MTGKGLDQSDLALLLEVLVQLDSEQGYVEGLLGPEHSLAYLALTAPVVEREDSGNCSLLTAHMGIWPDSEEDSIVTREDCTLSMDLSRWTNLLQEMIALGMSCRICGRCLRPCARWYSPSSN